MADIDVYPSGEHESRTEEPTDENIPLTLVTGKNLRFPIYVYNMVFGCLFNVFQETRKRNNFQFQDT